MSSLDLSDFKLNQIVRTVAHLHYSEYCSPSTIGHILKAKYNIVVKNLCKVFPFLNESKFQIQRLSFLNSKRNLHLEKNHKDVPCERSLVRSQLKLKLLKEAQQGK